VVKAAKKRKKEEEDEEFSFPEFDEEAYLRKEVDLSKASFVTIALAIPAGVLLYGLTLLQVPILAFFVGMAATFGLSRILPRIPWPKVDFAKFERKDWIGQGGTFFLAWLTVWVLLINVPFTDVTPPAFAGVSASDGRMTIAISPGIQNSGLQSGTIWINASIFENGGLESVSITVTGFSSSAMAPVPGFPTIWSTSIVLTSPANPTVTITARDAAGHETAFAFSLNV